MNTKGLIDKTDNLRTPDEGNVFVDKPSIPKPTTRRVDINVLKSKLYEEENKEFKKNLYVLSLLILILGVLGLYLSF
tara:strand:- start:292 stop:522 length:231 start_codon:yes stop_codon:yes gene_type:complete